jgi:alanyl-tRNA synthetase
VSTPRLYYSDAYQVDFSAVVIGHESYEDQPSVILDQTAFYPESGGQMADQGQLNQSDVVDVQVDEQGIVHHILKGPPPALHAKVAGQIDLLRRKTHMALHTGQHILSRALFESANADTVSARLGERECTIDLDQSQLTDGALQDAEDLANAVIDEDFSIRAYFPDASELSRLSMRNAPKVKDNIRMVSIGDFDHTPCGGTHCAQTSQVGFIRIVQVEKSRGQVRVQFESGIRGRKNLFEHHHQLLTLAGKMSCGPFDIEGAVEKLRSETKMAKEQLGITRSFLAKEMVTQLKGTADAQNCVVALLPDGDPAFLRQISRPLVEAGYQAFLAGPQKDKLMVVLANPTTDSIHCGHLLGKLVKKAGGRGGGKEHFAQGHMPANTDWLALVNEERDPFGEG